MFLECLRADEPPARVDLRRRLRTVPNRGEAKHIVHHAWAVDGDGGVYDPTLKGTEFFGIPFKPEYVKKTMRRILPDGFSILDNDLDLLRTSKSSRAWLKLSQFPPY